MVANRQPKFGEDLLLSKSNRRVAVQSNRVSVNAHSADCIRVSMVYIRWRTTVDEAFGEMIEEVLSNPELERRPIEEQVFYHLKLFEFDPTWVPRFCVYQARARLDKATEKFVWDEEELERFQTLPEAQAKYDFRRAELAVRGFTVSDMEW